MKRQRKFVFDQDKIMFDRIKAMQNNVDTMYQKGSDEHDVITINLGFLDDLFGLALIGSAYLLDLKATAAPCAHCKEKPIVKATVIECGTVGCPKAVFVHGSDYHDTINTWNRYQNDTTRI